MCCDEFYYLNMKLYYNISQVPIPKQWTKQNKQNYIMSI